jgi:transcription elongation factor Elf1
VDRELNKILTQLQNQELGKLLTCKFMCSDYSLLCTVKLRDQQQIYILKHCSAVRMSENRPRPMSRKTS